MAVYLRKRKLANSRFRYYLDVWHNGDRSYENLFVVEKSDDKKEKKMLAETIRSQRAVQLELEGTGFTPNFLRNIQVIVFCDKYTASYSKQDKRLVIGAVNKFKDFLESKNIGKSITFKQLTEGHFRGFADYLNYDSGLTGETPQNYWKKFKMIANQAKREGLINVAVYEDVKWNKREDYSGLTIKKQVLTEEEIAVLWEEECGNDEVKKAFLYACYTGLGYAEIKELTWRSIQNNKIFTQRKKTGKKVENAHSLKIIQALGEKKSDEEPVFNLVNKITGKYLSENGVNSCLKTWIKKAGITKHITFYCGRHTFATRLLINGTDLQTVADAMGHSNTVITSKYLNHISSLKDKATAGLL